MLSFLDRNKVHIQLDLGHNTVTPSDVLSGVLHLHVIKDVKIGSIQVELSGVEQSVLYDHTNPYVRRTVETKSFTHIHAITLLFTGGPTPMSTTGSCSGSSDGAARGTTHMMAGSSHQFPFSIDIPSDAPPSMQADMPYAVCALKYTLTARVQIPYGFDACLERPLTVRSIVPYTQYLEALRAPLCISPTTTQTAVSPTAFQSFMAKALPSLSSSLGVTAPSTGEMSCRVTLTPFLLPISHVCSAHEQSLWTEAYHNQQQQQLPMDTLSPSLGSSSTGSSTLASSCESSQHSQQLGGSTSISRGTGNGKKKDKRKHHDRLHVAAVPAASGPSRSSPPLPPARGGMLTVQLDLANVSVAAPVYLVQVKLLQRVTLSMVIRHMEHVTEIACGQRVIPQGLTMGQETTVTVTLDVPSDVRACEELSSQLPLPTVETKTLRVETMLEVTFPGAEVSNPVREPGLVYVSSVVDRDDVVRPMPQVFNASIKPPIDHQLGSGVL